MGNEQTESILLNEKPEKGAVVLRLFSALLVGETLHQSGFERFTVLVMLVGCCN